MSSLDLGLIGNESLKYLAKNLENPHHLDSIWFGESMLFCYIERFNRQVAIRRETGVPDSDP